MPPIHKSWGRSFADHWSSIRRPIGKVPTKISNVSSQIIKHQPDTQRGRAPTFAINPDFAAASRIGSREPAPSPTPKKPLPHGHVCQEAISCSSHTRMSASRTMAIDPVSRPDSRGRPTSRRPPARGSRLPAPGPVVRVLRQAPLRLDAYAAKRAASCLRRADDAWHARGPRPAARSRETWPLYVARACSRSLSHVLPTLTATSASADLNVASFFHRFVSFRKFRAPFTR